MTSTKYQIVTREEELEKPSNFVLEAAANDEIIALLGLHRFKQTPEKCRADAGFFVTDPEFSLATQSKACTFCNNGKYFNPFQSTSGYDGMILLCRPMPRLYIGTLAIPGNIASDNLRLNLSEKSKYLPYLVPDTLLLNFLTKLHTAVSRKLQTCEWPSGIQVNISQLKISSYDALCTPQGSCNIIERQNHEWRLQALPNIVYTSLKFK